ncbi:Liprin-beta-1 [Sarcoptes scabiei]|nr:Liprin-beta-1 [Sarcoptes scabiei]
MWNVKKIEERMRERERILLFSSLLLLLRYRIETKINVPSKQSNKPTKKKKRWPQHNNVDNKFSQNVRLWRGLKISHHSRSEKKLSILFLLMRKRIIIKLCCHFFFLQFRFSSFETIKFHLLKIFRESYSNFEATKRAIFSPTHPPSSLEHPKLHNFKYAQFEFYLRSSFFGVENSEHFVENV